MRKKILAVMSAVVITTLAFTGCGSSNETSTDKASDGVSGEITVVSREEGSGTRDAFVELLGILDEEENDLTTQMAEVTNSTSVMISTVAQNEKAIGYVSLGSLSDDVKSIQVDGVDATAENIKSGSYKVSRPFNLAYKEDALTDLDKDFIKFIMSEQGQAVVDQEGYISLDAEGSYESAGLKGKITLAGSTSVAPLMDVMKDEYVKLNPDVTIEIQESGSSAGIQSAMEGATEIGMSSRELKEDEAKELTSKQNDMDGIAVIVNKNNTTDNLTSEQIQSIYTGDVTDWADVK